MPPPKPTFTTIDEYHVLFPEDVQVLLNKMRKAINQAAPKVTEVISYGMPGFRQHGVLVWYAANKKHIGFYPSSGPIQVFAEELKDYVTSKGAIQFPLDKPIPVTLVKKIVKFRMQQDAESVALKAKKKK